ncbi:MAG: extradiol ring-cleavage dioxygenase [Dehalococcoidia bacterium]
MVDQETDEDNQYRFKAVSGTLDLIRESFKAAELDALLVIGDDQNENFTEHTYIPQFAIYTGEDFVIPNREDPQDLPRYNVHSALAEHLYMDVVEADFDLVGIHSFPDKMLKSHAIGPVLQRVDPQCEIKIVPFWVEGIHMPAPSPRRCYALGQAIGAAIESWPGEERIGVIASGGLSHFTGGYPFKHAPGTTYGNIEAEYDRNIVIAALRSGRGESLNALTTRDLLDNGLIELRSWITVAGMIGAVKTKEIVYEPFFRGIMGMGVAYWDVEAEKAVAAV